MLIHRCAALTAVIRGDVVIIDSQPNDGDDVYATVVHALKLNDT